MILGGDPIFINVLYVHVSEWITFDSPHLISQFKVSFGPTFVIGIEFDVNHKVEILSRHSKLIVDSRPIFDMFPIPWETIVS